MAALTDHRLTKDELRKSQNLNNDILKYVEKNNSPDESNAHRKLIDVLIKFAKTGALSNANLPKFLLRHVLELRFQASYWILCLLEIY